MNGLPISTNCWTFTYAVKSVCTFIVRGSFRTQRLGYMVLPTPSRGNYKTQRSFRPNGWDTCSREHPNPLSVVVLPDANEAQKKQLTTVMATSIEVEGAKDPTLSNIFPSSIDRTKSFNTSKQQTEQRLVLLFALQVDWEFGSCHLSVETWPPPTWQGWLVKAVYPTKCRLTTTMTT